MRRIQIVTLVISGSVFALAVSFPTKAYNNQTQAPGIRLSATNVGSSMADKSLPVYKPAQEVTERNWQQHPQIVAIRKIVSEVDAGLRRRAFKISQRKFDSCWNGDTSRRIAHDAKGVVRYYETYGYGEESDRTFKQYYDAFGSLRFVYIIDRWSGIITARIYFDENRKRVWENYKRVKGEPTPGTFGPFVDDQLLKNPEEGFRSPSDCREIQRKARHRSR